MIVSPSDPFGLSLLFRGTSVFWPTAHYRSVWRCIPAVFRDFGAISESWIAQQRFSLLFLRFPSVRSRGNVDFWLGKRLFALIRWKELIKLSIFVSIPTRTSHAERRSIICLGACFCCCVKWKRKRLSLVRLRRFDICWKALVECSILNPGSSLDSHLERTSEALFFLCFGFLLLLFEEEAAEFLASLSW